MKNRVFLIVMDSVGVGELPDAADFGDTGSNTMKTCMNSGKLKVPTLESLGLFHMDGACVTPPTQTVQGSFGRLAEKSRGKDTTIGHWEIAGIVSPKALPTYPNGFPKEIIEQFEALSGRKTLCNLPYSGTEVLDAYGEEHMKTGALIVYTSADSVFQIAAHEEVVPLEQLYSYCDAARALLAGEHGVGRVIARPFLGAPGSFKRTTNRHDYSLQPPKATMLTHLQAAGLASIGVGKIFDIFDGVGVDKRIPTTSNTDGMEKTLEFVKNGAFEGLCFVNLVDFDMLYGHRNDIAGYTAALNSFDAQLATLLPLMRPDDILMITADHGCDPGTASTDHSREYVPFLAYGAGIKAGVNLGTRASFADIGATVLDIFGIDATVDGTSFWNQICK